MDILSGEIGLKYIYFVIENFIVWCYKVCLRAHTLRYVVCLIQKCSIDVINVCFWSHYVQ